MSVDNCAVCGDQWKTREPESFDTGAKSIPMICGTRLTSHHGKKTIKLLFCDKHFRNLRHVTKYMIKTGVLKIRNIITNKWRYASALGVVVQ